MKIVIAPDSFKESLSAFQVAECIQKGFSQVFPEAEYTLMPLADGGEGTVEVLLHGLEGTKQYSHVTGPDGKETLAEWAILDDGKTALIEIAQASGLDRVPVELRDPTLSTSYGTGELIREALDRGVSKVLLGLGGSATNDAGAGIVKALGGKLLDSSGCSVEEGGLALSELHSIDLSDIHPRCSEVEFVIACDVVNPLCGHNGASFVFGPQKGASEEQVKQLDLALSHFACIVASKTGQNHIYSASFGAAGGTPLGLSLLFGLEIKPGIEMVLDTLEADKVLNGCDLVITGEGKIDNQTIQGKTPYGIAKRAKVQGIPVIGISGSMGLEVDKLHSAIDSIFGTVRSPQPLIQVLEEAEVNLVRVARNVAATVSIGHQLQTA